MLAWRFVMTPDKRCAVICLPKRQPCWLTIKRQSGSFWSQAKLKRGVGPQLEASVLKARYLDNLNMLEAKHANGERVSGLVVADTKGGFSVALGVSSFEEVLAGKGIRAFMPRKQSGGQRTSRDEIRGLHGIH